MTRVTRFARLGFDQRGATLVEFALIAPVMCMLLLGGFDMGHTMYMRAQVQGIVQKAARDSSLEQNNTDTAQDSIDVKVRRGILALANNATIDINRRYFRTFADAAAKKGEKIINDANNNNLCDYNKPKPNDESYIDVNNNKKWDPDGGDDEGGAMDRAVYTVKVSYPRMFPILYFTGPSRTEVQAVTILENQPWADQNQTEPPTTRPCPAP